MINTRVKPQQQRASSIINPRLKISESNKAAKEAQKAALKMEENRKKLEKSQNINRILSIKGEERKQMLSNFANYLNQTSIRTNKPSIVSKLRNKASSNQNFNYNTLPENSNIKKTEKQFWSMIYADYNSFRKNKEAKRLAKEEQNRLTQQQEQQNTSLLSTVTSALETASTAVSNAVQNMTNPPPSPVQTVVNNKNAKLRSLVNQTSKEFVNLEGKLKELRGAVGLSPNISAAAEGGSKKKKRSKSKKSKSKSRK